MYQYLLLLAILIGQIIGLNLVIVTLNVLNLHLSSESTLKVSFSLGILYGSFEKMAFLIGWLFILIAILRLVDHVILKKLNLLFEHLEEVKTVSLLRQEFVQFSKNEVVAALADLVNELNDSIDYRLCFK